MFEAHKLHLPLWGSHGQYGDLRSALTSSNKLNRSRKAWDSGTPRKAANSGSLIFSAPLFLALSEYVSSSFSSFSGFSLSKEENLLKNEKNKNNNSDLQRWL